MSITAAATTDICSLTASLPNKYPITLMIWAYLPATMGNNIYDIFTFEDGGGTANWIMGFESASSVYSLVFYSSSGGIAGATTKIGQNGWHNLAVTVAAGGTVTAYIDGIDATISNTASSVATAIVLSIGASPAGAIAPFNNSVGAKLYGAKIWNVELTSGQVATEVTSYSPILTTNLYDSWRLATVGSAGTARNNGHNFTTVTGWVDGVSPPGSDVDAGLTVLTDLTSIATLI